MGTGLDELTSAIDALVARPPHELGDAESIVDIHRQLARLDAVRTRAEAAFDASRRWADDGATSAAAWVSSTCHVPKQVAAKRIACGRALRDMPTTEEAWLDGSITGDHARVLAHAHDSAESAFRQEERVLVSMAREAGWRAFLRRVAYWRQVNDEEGTENEARRQLDARSLHLSQSFQGAWFLDGTFDPIGGSIVSDTLREIERALFEQDWADAELRLGRTPSIIDLDRTPAQRRADALVEMATRARTAPANGRRPEPLFSVFVDYETFAGRLCQLANGTVVTPGSLVPWLDRAWAERMVFGPASRVLDVGQRQRLFTGADRRAVVARDLAECFHETCDETGDHLQVDHIEPWFAGGETVQDNGRAACPTHNRQRHRRPRGNRPPRGP